MRCKVCGKEVPGLYSLAGTWYEREGYCSRKCYYTENCF